MSRPFLPGIRLLRIARHVCGPRAMEHVVRPAVADLQHEFAEWTGRETVRPTWRTAVVLLRGYWACWAAVTRIWLLGFEESPGVAPSSATLLRRTVTTSVGFAAVYECFFLIGGGDQFVARAWHQAGALAAIDMALLEAPSSLTLLAGPALLAVLLAAGPSLGRQRRRTLTVAVATTLAVFLLSSWIMPVTNDAFRHRVSDYLASRVAGHLRPRGPNEMSLTELPSGLKQLYAHLPVERRRSLLNAEMNVRLALPASCLAFGFLGWVLSCRIQSARRGALRTGAIVLVMSLAWLLLFAAGVTWARRGVVPAVGVWGANVVFALASTAVWLATRRSSPRSATGYTLSGRLQPAPTQLV